MYRFNLSEGDESSPESFQLYLAEFLSKLRLSKTAAALRVPAAQIAEAGDAVNPTIAPAAKYYSARRIVSDTA
jgi:hypothetical protein